MLYYFTPALLEAALYVSAALAAFSVGGAVGYLAGRAGR